jgi:hypothetical protein
MQVWRGGGQHMLVFRRVVRWAVGRLSRFRDML